MIMQSIFFITYIDKCSIQSIGSIFLILARKHHQREIYLCQLPFDIRSISRPEQAKSTDEDFERMISSLLIMMI